MLFLNLEKMKSTIYIISSSLKDLLELFDPKLELEDIILGDTCHPSSGFVDEKILNGKMLISDLISFDYDFRGLVEFKANYKSVQIEMLSRFDEMGEYQIIGDAKEIETIKNLIIEKNSYQPNKYKFDYKLKY
jgi:hypothetical protein